MKINTHAGLYFATLLGIPCSGVAAESHRCSVITHDTRRLACYDSDFGKPARPVATAPPMAQARPPVSAPKKPVTGQVAAVGRLADDRLAVTLDNGQQWMQLERDASVDVRVGDAVEIKPALLGSWMLQTPGGIRTRVRLAK